MTTPPRDLTAERAAEQVIEDWKAYDPSGFRIGHLEHLITTALKTARQEALREAAQVCRDRAVLLEPSSKRWELNMVSKAKSDEANDLADKLDRLASEGG